MAYLLDTNIVSELRKVKIDVNVQRWYEAHRTAEVYLSTLVVGEIRQGIERIRTRDAQQAAGLEGWLAGLLSSYQNRLLPVTVDIAQEWGRLRASAGVPVVDGLMVATANVHRLTLVTRKVADVARTGVRLVNPFEPA